METPTCYETRLHPNNGSANFSIDTNAFLNSTGEPNFYVWIKKNTEVLSDEPNQNSITNQDILGSKLNDQFIKFKKLFYKQLDLLEEKYDSDFIDLASSKFDSTLNMLIEMHPDTLSIEVTYDHSVYFTFKKYDFKFYLQHFLNDIGIGEDEAILTVFKGTKKLPSFAGGLHRTVQQIENDLRTETD